MASQDGGWLAVSRVTPQGRPESSCSRVKNKNHPCCAGHLGCQEEQAQGTCAGRSRPAGQNRQTHLSAGQRCVGLTGPG